MMTVRAKRLFENCLFYPISALSEEFTLNKLSNFQTASNLPQFRNAAPPTAIKDAKLIDSQRLFLF
jgi:hypothetical protein